MPPSGPAIPVVDIAISEFEESAAPLAISIAVCSETAPYVSKVSLLTPKMLILDSFE